MKTSRIAFAFLLLAATPVFGAEVMSDKCSAEVAFTSYNSRPDTPGAIVLKRGSNGKTAWSAPFKVTLGPDGHIRWWCHSTTGNAFDPGTWRIQELTVGTKCQIYADGTPESCRPDGGIKIGSSAWKDWTPERSRCNDRSNKIRARLDGGRLLQIECMGH